MATKRKTKKGSRSTGAAGRKATPKRRATKGASAKKSAKKKAAPKKSVAKQKNLHKKATNRKAAGGNRNKTRKKSPGLAEFALEPSSSRSGEQSGDLQGLSGIERADSESVDELVEEGNAFEAGVVSGVEDAERRAEREVRTREVPEDDVPGEYLDEE
ncbi:MAG TPA: hypothetical protein VNZ03_17635 [Terriglobales bacterium]|jgi:hypothetical protein|nr:hypothetical protein [Terriglobales bacterium]